MLTFIILKMYVVFSIFHFDLNMEDIIVDGTFDDRFVDVRTTLTVSVTGQEGISSVVLV